MREIKFRAWDKKGKKWFVDLSICIQTTRDGRLDCFNDGIPMQYTGLKDKNGKEIYEGDILKKTYKAPIQYMETTLGEIIFLNGAFVVKDKNYHSIMPEWVEVIGNIYENPDLLKEGAK